MRTGDSPAAAAAANPRADGDNPAKLPDGPSPARAAAVFSAACRGREVPVTGRVYLSGRPPGPEVRPDRRFQSEEESSAAAAETGGPESSTAAFQFVGHGQNYPGAGHPNRVTQSNCPTI